MALAKLKNSHFKKLLERNKGIKEERHRYFTMCQDKKVPDNVALPEEKPVV